MTPQDEDAVRRLLADAAHRDPLPDDVAARLEGVLAGLAAPGAGAAEERPAATVTPLAQRRRNASRLLVAAAAVVLVGVGVGQVLDGTSGGAGQESATAGRTTADDAGEAEAPSETAGGAGAGGAGAAELAPDDDRASLRDGVVRLRSKTFVTDVTELSSRFEPYAVDSQDGVAESQSSPLRGSFAAAAAACRAPSWGKGRFVAVRYDRAPAVLVFRRASGDTQVADLFLCGSTTPARSVTLPAP